MEHDSFTIEAMIRAYHVYSDIWNATIDEELLCAKEFGSLADPFAIADSIASYTCAGKEFSQVLIFAHVAHVRNMRKFAPF